MKSFQTVCLLLASACVAAAQQYTISTVAGQPGSTGLYPVAGDTSTISARSALLYHPATIALDASGNFYIADYYNCTVYRITASTGNITGIAGNLSGACGFGGDNEAATTANLTDIHGIAVDGSGNVFISDTSNHRVRRVDAKSGIMTTFAGNGTKAYSGDGGAATSASFIAPGALAFDAKGNLYVADYAAGVVRMITSGGTVSTFAGTGTYGNTGDGGAASKANLAYPVSVVFDGNGNLYIGDEGNSNIRKVDASGNITTAATGIVARGLGVDSTGIYFVDGISSTVRKALFTGGVVTLAGNGQNGFADSTSSSQVILNQASALALAADGSLYVADTMNDIIRRLVPVANSVGYQDSASQYSGSLLRPGNIAPGEIVTLFGSGLGPATLTSATPANGQYPTQLAGTSVTFNNVPAAIIYTSANLVTVATPYEITGSSTASIVVTYQGKTYTATAPVATTVPALFTRNQSGIGQAAAVNVSDGSINSPASPAKLGSYISLYATGEGYTTAPVDGKTASSTCGASCLPTPVLPISVKIGTQCVNPSYAGGAPTLIAGVMQVNVQIPTGILPGTAVPVQIQAGTGCPGLTSYQSQLAVTIAVTQ